MALVNIIIAYLVRYSYSIFFVAILEEFQWSRATTMGALSLSLVVYSVGAPFIGGLVDRYGIKKVVPLGAIALSLSLLFCSAVNSVWQMYLAFGLTAVGTLSLGYVPHLTIIANWFIRRRGLAMGIATAGLSLTMLLVPFLQILILSFGWRNTYIILAASTIVIPIPLIFLFLREKPEDMGLKADDAKETTETRTDNKGKKREMTIVDEAWASNDWTLGGAARTIRLWSLVMMAFTYGIWSYSIMMHQVAFLIDAGYGKEFGASIVGIFGLTATLGAVAAFVSDKWGREKTYTLSALGAIVGLIFFQLSRGAYGPVLPYIYVVVFGFSFGVSSPLLAATAADLFQGKHLGVINGLVMGSFVIGGAVGAWLTGWIYDFYGSYYPTFPLLYFLVLLSAFFTWMAAPRKVRRTAP
ncbi:MAG: MFS transporter [Dehalococcoidia bacterium]|nr:MFS transporter [Dehalococcoidia bacterium]